MRARLTLLVAATTVLVLLAFLVPLAVLVRQVAQDRALGRADDVVQSIVPLAATGDTTALRLTVEAQTVPVTVFLPDGGILGTPAEATPAVRLAAAQHGALTVTTGAGQELVVPVVGTGGATVIRTLVTEAELTRGVTRAWATLAALGFTLVLLGLFVADRLARTITRPISELSAVSHRLAGAELTARADPSGPPELREVAGALNHLASRIQDLLAAERERVADLSHRLRTPLTALRLEAESLRDPDESARVAAAADQLARAVTAVIQQTRRADPTPDTAGCDATVVVAARVAFWSVLAEDTGRPLHQELPAGPARVAVAADDLAAALDALLGNVFAHTPDGTALAVTLAAHPGGGATLTVADDGPGFPAAHSESPSGDVAHRGTSGGGSTGLGLDIARKIASSFTISPPGPGGAVIRLDLPGTQEPSP
ncbi:ATP-binding protein [Actinoplanes subglobosus]|uniref:histidine kinase n=1 Tax=Actinoplanes subglobosus TaxID=1547892 RepID=A0ABV8J3Y9_9ACTN